MKESLLCWTHRAVTCSRRWWGSKCSKTSWISDGKLPPTFSHNYWKEFPELVIEGLTSYTRTNYLRVQRFWILCVQLEVAGGGKMWFPETDTVWEQDKRPGVLSPQDLDQQDINQHLSWALLILSYAKNVLGIHKHKPSRWMTALHPEYMTEGCSGKSLMDNKSQNQTTDSWF